MKKYSIKQIEIIGGFFIFFMGALDHFLYDWTRFLPLGLISPVNESPWEHLKIFFFPMLLFMILEWIFIKDKKTLLLAKAMESIVAIIFIITFFYTYTGALGIENVWIDIASFGVAVVLGQWVSYKILTAKIKWRGYLWLHVTVIVLIVIMFWVTTFIPPHIPLFYDNVANSYGLN